jgi:hypothetical protein
MTKLLIGTLSLALVGVGGLVAAVDGFGDEQPVRSVSLPAGTTGEDVPGPCDEPEHANQPGCTGVGRTTTDADDDDAPARPTTGTTTVGRGDISGPCDEPEHANDPRCTGAGTTTDAHDDRDDDRSGPGRGGSGNGDDDRSGSNSGKS